ncbi:glutaminyl-peptide cyclotransferase-like protein isoform X3 [Ascaphus truei]|uniref:glutaminyl-peptide cyclotransferase-like protein isoform X3 n=1 Tax=Ascaphus truei TaxID=8439 RepID=UPI003F595F0A
MSPRLGVRSPGAVHHHHPSSSPRPWIPGPRCLLVLGVGVLISVGLVLWESGTPSRTPGEEKREELRSSPLSSSQIRQLVSEVSVDRLWTSFLRPMLIERPPGSKGNSQVRELISNHLRSLSSGWTVDLDLFNAITPRGSLSFGNVVATLDPAAHRRLVIACHIDSKWFPLDGDGRPFIGATDSAVPCSLILEAVTVLDNRLRGLKDKALFVLLDLLGAPDPLILNHYTETREYFMRLCALEKRLHRLGLLQSHPTEQSYFRRDVYYGPVEDDHIPFVRRGVPVLHVISTPFPAVWHTTDDNEDNLHPPTIINLCRILVTFLSETLLL